jgi:hypothetical protein
VGAAGGGSGIDFDGAVATVGGPVRVGGSVDPGSNDGGGGCDARGEELGELFAVSTAISVHHAQIPAHTKCPAAQLQAALTSQAVIDQAIGILISRSGDTRLVAGRPR